MKRSLQCAFGLSALFISSSAFAQNFGEKGTLGISAERLFGFYHESDTQTDANVEHTTKYDSFSLLSSPVAHQVYGAPRVAGDYFVIDHLSIGGAIGYSHLSTGVEQGNTTVSSGTDSFLFAPRVGWAYMFNDIVGIWPRAGFTYVTFPDPNGGHDFAFTAEVPFVFTVIPHVAFWAGPTLDLGIGGAHDTTDGLGRTVSQDFNATAIGIQTGMTAYFNLL